MNVVDQQKLLIKDRETLNNKVNGLITSANTYVADQSKQTINSKKVTRPYNKKTPEQKQAELDKKQARIDKKMARTSVIDNLPITKPTIDITPPLLSNKYSDDQVNSILNATQERIKKTQSVTENGITYERYDVPDHISENGTEYIDGFAYS